MEGFVILAIALFGTLLWGLNTWKKPEQKEYKPVPVPIELPNVPVPAPKPIPKPMRNTEILYAKASSNECLGHDMSPKDVAPDRLACAESLNGVWKAAFGTVLATGAALTGTNALYKALLNDSRFELSDTPEVGCIVISPTGYSTKGAQHGHVGIWGNYDVMSNDSSTGKWADNYTHAAWYDVFHKTLGFPVYFFKVLD